MVSRMVGGGWGVFSLFIAAYTNMDTIPLAYRKSHRSLHMPHHFFARPLHL